MSRARRQRAVLHTPAEQSDSGVDEISMFGVVGWEITAGEVRDALAAIERGSPIKVDLNSPGGFWGEGVAIFSMLNRWEGDVEVEVLGEAGSAASFMAMAGNTTIIHEMATFFVHKPWVMMIGNEDDLDDEANTLRKLTKVMTTTYMKRFDGGVEELTELIKGKTGNGTTMTAEEAVDYGFMDAIWGEESDDVSARASRLRAASRSGPRNDWYKDMKQKMAGDMSLLAKSLDEIASPMSGSDQDELQELSLLMDKLEDALFSG